MSLGILLKLFSLAAGVTVVAPISYIVAPKTLISSSVTYEDNCTHLPIKRGGETQKLLVCLGASKTSPVFKWKEDGREAKKISSLSWERKVSSSEDLFVLKIQLQGANQSIEVEGDGHFYLPPSELKEMENNCSLSVGETKNKFIFECREKTDEVEGKTHSIATSDVNYHRS